MGTPKMVVHVSHKSRFIWPDVNCDRCGMRLLPDMLSRTFHRIMFGVL